MLLLTLLQWAMLRPVLAQCETKQPPFISMRALFGAARVMDTMTAAMTTFQTSKTLSH